MRGLVGRTTLIIGLLLSTGAAMAATPNQSQGLEITPLIVERRTDPGKTITATIRLLNISNNNLVANGEVEDFVAKGEDGQPQILLETNERSPYSLKDWVTIPRDTYLAKGEAKTVAITMRVPASASPGGHYGVVRFTGRPPEVEGQGVSLAPSLGSLILLNVSGQVKEQLKIEEFKPTFGGKPGWLFENGPLTFMTRLRNTGNVHVKPQGNVQVTGWFGQKARLTLNEKGGNVLPDSIRRFENSWGKKWMFGRFQAYPEVAYGTQGQTLVGERYAFWVLPWKLLLLVLAVLLALIYLGRGGLKRYNAYIIRKSRR